MGFLDTIKKLGDFPKRKKTPLADGPSEPLPKIILSASEQDFWPDQMVKAFEIDELFDEFLDRVKDESSEIREALEVLTKEDTIAKIPERARTINALHANEYVDQAKKLLNKSVFTNIYAFDDEHTTFQTAITAFRETTKRNVVALSEYLGVELQKIANAIKSLEDEIIGMLKILEERKFDQISIIKRELTALRHLDERRSKYGSLVQSLEEDKTRNAEKQSRINEEIRKQQALIRNDEAHSALERLGKVELEMNTIVHSYASLCTDVVKFLKKQEIEVPSLTRKTLDEATRDAARMLATNHGVIKDALDTVASLLEEEGRGSVGHIITKCRALSETSVEDGKSVADAIALQKQLRQAVMRDVAAIAVYDQQQFLLRAKNDEAEIVRKLEFLAMELNPAKRIEHERAIKDATSNLGATIIGDEPSKPSHSDASTS